MTKYSITLYSKSKNSLNFFFKFLKLSLNIGKFKLPLYSIKKPTNKQIITVLKSPHVNKTAQEQFGFKLYSIKIFIQSYKIQKSILLLKRIKNQLFANILIKIDRRFSSNKNILITPNSNTFKLSNFNKIKQTLSFKKLQNYKKNNNSFNKKLLKKTVSYLKTLDLYGNLRFTRSNKLDF